MLYFYLKYNKKYSEAVFVIKKHLIIWWSRSIVFGICTLKILTSFNYVKHCILWHLYWPIQVLQLYTAYPLVPATVWPSVGVWLSISDCLCSTDIFLIKIQITISHFLTLRRKVLKWNFSAKISKWLSPGWRQVY